MRRPPLPPFTAETAAQKVRMAGDAWNTRDPARVALAYTADSRWRNRTEFFQGREAIEAFLQRKWNRELDLMRGRTASTNALPIKESEPKYQWPLGGRPDSHPASSDLGL